MLAGLRRTVDDASVDRSELIARFADAHQSRPDVREAFGKFACEPLGSTPEELGAFTREQLAIWRRAVREAGIKPE